VVGGEGGQCTELVDDIVADFIGSEVHCPAAETAQVREAGVSADAYTLADAFGHRSVHDVRVARVEAAGNVGAGHDIQERCVVTHRVGTKTFTKIRDKIDCGHFGAFLCWVFGA